MTKKLKPSLVASYNIRPGNGEGPFLFWCLINLSLTYLLIQLEYGPMPNVMVALPNIGGALCSMPLSLADAQY